jgi:DNA recombination protein RmuC
LFWRCSFFCCSARGRKDETVEPGFRAVEGGLERLERELRQELARVRQEAASAARGDREEQAQALDRLAKTLSTQVGQLGALQGQQLEAFAQQLARLTQSNEQRFEQLRVSVETRLGAIQADNASKLEEMRKTVDEKLHATLEQRLGDSFKLVSERLEQVHKGPRRNAHAGRRRRRPEEGADQRQDARHLG